MPLEENLAANMTNAQVTSVLQTDVSAVWISNRLASRTLRLASRRHAPLDNPPLIFLAQAAFTTSTARLKASLPPSPRHLFPRPPQSLQRQLPKSPRLQPRPTR